MPCLFTIIALAAPRLVILVLWLLTHWFRGVFHGVLLPILGFFLLPTTLLWYSVVHNWFGAQWTFWPIVGLVVALCIDLSPARHRRWRRDS